MGVGRGMRQTWIALTVAGLAFGLGAPAGAQTLARVDPSFGNGGHLFTPLASGLSGPRSSRVAVDSRGRLVALGSAGDHLVLARYLPDGELDSSFGLGGLTSITPSNEAGERENDEARAGALVIQPDGMILLGGSYDPDLVIEGGSGSAELILARVREDGDVDLGFGGGARKGVPPGIAIERRGTKAFAIAVEAGEILVGGETRSGDPFVARYSPDGTLDKGFGRGTGMVSMGRGQARGAITSLRAEPGGGLYAAGYLGGKFLLARLSRSGLPDRRFGKRGRVLTDAGPRKGCSCSLGGGLARDRRGRLLVSGTVLKDRPTGPVDPERLLGAEAVAVARYSPSGALDRRFGEEGVARTRIGALTHGWGIALRHDGGIFVAGSSANSINGPARLAVVGYRPDGSRDRRFFGDGIYSAALGAYSSRAWQPVVDRSGRVVVAGSAALSSGLRPEPASQGLLLTRFLMPPG